MDIDDPGAAQTADDVIGRHRALIGRGLDLTSRMLDEIDAATAHQGEIAAAFAGDDGPAKVGAVAKVVTLPGRSALIRDLSSAAKNWVALDREAHGVEGGPRRLELTGKDGQAVKIAPDVVAVLTELDTMSPIERKRLVEFGLELMGRSETHR